MSKKVDTKKASLKEALNMSTNDLFFPTAITTAAEDKPEENNALKDNTIKENNIDTQTNQENEDTVVTDSYVQDGHVQNTPTKHNFPSRKQKEIKNKRISVVLTPSLHKKLIEFTTLNECSMNEVLCYALNEFLSE